MIQETIAYSNISCDMTLVLAGKIRQAALKACAPELDLCVKKIGFDNRLGHRVAKTIQSELRGTDVSVRWIPNSHHLCGSLLLLNGQYAAAFSSAPSISPDALSLVVNELAIKRGAMHELFAVTPSLPEEALRAIFESCRQID